MWRSPLSPRQLDDCTLQLSHNGTYLDLESSLAEQRDELEGFQPDDTGWGWLTRSPRSSCASSQTHMFRALHPDEMLRITNYIGRSWWKEWGVLESRSDVSFFPLLEFFCQITLINYIYILLLFYQTSFKLGIGVLNFVFCEINKPKYLLVWRRIFSCSLLQSSRSKWV